MSTATGSMDKALIGQLGGYPRALGLSAFLMLSLALLPGIPAVPFLALSGLAAAGAWFASKKKAGTAAAEAKSLAAKSAAPVAEEPIANALQIDQVRLELGYGLLPMINGHGGQRLTDQIKSLRRQLAQEIGFVMPSRSEERRVGTECVSTCRSRWSPAPYKSKYQ